MPNNAFEPTCDDARGSKRKLGCIDVPNNSHLLARIGQRLRSVTMIVGERHVYAISMEFEEGKPIVLGCAGDGGIYSRKTRITEHAAVANRLWEGAILKAVDQNSNSLLLYSSVGRMLVRNIDDTLLVSFES